ncbi:MAG: bifunctional 4-hydroxy-2-oxoglutarate aldolase/2-dehydro-3-deoxy-phosphogluconate aldolase [Tistlia sp.]|uniref:bifunctional 4-hydroxy-2-oxoglutarate aldolase/2-dehydro-3-deoxy-phosphogluconate aldolase n=1 Tax=Tistlia sp. TaxID=3057121 RepID=UPI0034A53064
MSGAFLDPGAAATEAWRRPGIVPVVTVTEAGQAVPLARALASAGLVFVEVTLRSEAALEAIRRIAGELPEVVVGAGTLRRPADFEAALAAGARFLVSPGCTAALIEAAPSSPVPFLPGCATPSEAMTLAEAGFRVVKFFPAGPYGGAATLKALAAPLPDLAFVPTGGVGPGNLADYLALDNVVAVGGSWMIRPEWLAAGDYGRITEAARQAAALGRG